MPWPDATPEAEWRNAAIDAIATSSSREWKKASGYHRRSLVENLMYRLETLTGHSLWARKVGSQATEVVIRAGGRNQMAALARSPSASPELLLTGIAPPSNSIYSTTPPHGSAPESKKC